jgi:hypothetical protein
MQKFPDCRESETMATAMGRIQATVQRQREDELQQLYGANWKRNAKSA